MLINRKELQSALQIVKPGLGKNVMIEQSTSFAIKNGNVVTYNDEISIMHPIAGLDFEGAVSADEFFALISKFKGDEIDLSVVDNELIITSGKARAGFVFQAEIKLPIFEFNGNEQWLDLPDNFNEQLDKVRTSCGNDTMKPALMCVSVQKSKLIATDNYKIIRANLTSEMEKNFLIPQTACKSIVEIQPTQYFIDENWIVFKNELGTILLSRVLFDSYPNVDRLFILSNEREVGLPESLDEILEKASILTKNADKINETVYVTLEKNKITIKSKSTEAWYEETARCKYDDESVEFGIAPALIKDILTKTKICYLAENNRLMFKSEDWDFLVLTKILY